MDARRTRPGRDAISILEKTGRVMSPKSDIPDVTEDRRGAVSPYESDEKFRLVANTAPVMIWMSGTDRLFNYVNQQWLDFTGRPFAEELANGWADNVHPEDLKACMDTYLR